MSSQKLAPGKAVTLALTGVLDVRVVTQGSRVSAQLSLDGPGQFNRMSASGYKLLGCDGEISVSIRAGEGTDFSSTVTATVQISSGRPGSIDEEIVELPSATLTDLSPLRVATLKKVDAGLNISAANTSVGQAVAGLGGIVRSKLRPLIDSSQSYLPDNMGIRVVVDSGAAMSTPALFKLIPEAVSIVSGSVAACATRGTVELQCGSSGVKEVDLGELESHITEIVSQGQRYVGGSEYVGDGLDELVFVISDVVPAVVESGESNAIALVLGDNPVDVPVAGAAGAIVNVNSALKTQLNAPLVENTAQSNPLGVVSEAISNVVRGTLPGGSAKRLPRGASTSQESQEPGIHVPTWSEAQVSDTTTGSSFSSPTVDIPVFGGPQLPGSARSVSALPGIDEDRRDGNGQPSGEWR